MQKQQSNITYKYNNKEVSKEEFNSVSKELFKWFEGDTINSVPFSSVSNFLDGDFKSQRQINNHLKYILDLGQIKGSSTRHKSQNGETHKELTVEDKLKIAESFKKEALKQLNITLEDIKTQSSQSYYTSPEKKEEIKKKCLERLIQESSVENNISDLAYLISAKNKKQLNKRLAKISAEKTEKEENLVFQKDSEIHKDDIITNTSRGEKETMGYLQGVKEAQTIEKAPIFTYCKVNKNALEALSLRALYGHKKYKETDQDWQNFTRVPNALEEYANASFRHALGIGEEDEETHLIASAWNAVAKLEVFLRDKLNKS